MMQLVCVLTASLALVAGCYAPGAPAAPQPGAQPSPKPATVQASAQPVAVPTLQVGPTGGPPDPNTVPVPPAGSCHVTAKGLPDPVCTPGALNPTLTAAQLCAAGFTTKTIRPPVSYTDRLKVRLMASYGQVGTSPLTGKAWSTADVELDHVASLEDLGHPWSPANLFPQPRRSTGAEPNAEEKDVVENFVHKQICADQAHGTDYAARLAADWTQFRTQALSAPGAAQEPTPEPEP